MANIIEIERNSPSLKNISETGLSKIVTPSGIVYTSNPAFPNLNTTEIPQRFFVKNRPEDVAIQIDLTGDRLSWLTSNANGVLNVQNHKADVALSLAEGRKIGRPNTIINYLRYGNYYFYDRLYISFPNIDESSNLFIIDSKHQIYLAQRTKHNKFSEPVLFSDELSYDKDVVFIKDGIEYNFNANPDDLIIIAQDLTYIYEIVLLSNLSFPVEIPYIINNFVSRRETI